MRSKREYHGNDTKETRIRRTERAEKNQRREPRSTAARKEQQ